MAIIGRSQGPLRRGQDTGDPRIDPRRVGERAPDGFEDRLRDVVEVVAVVHRDVERELGVERECAEELLQEIEIEVGDARACDRHLEDEERPPRHVHRRRDERLVHRDERGPEPHDPPLVAEGLVDRLAQHDADVLDGMVLVDLDVTLRLDGEVHETVLRPGLQHVAEERDRRLHLRGAGAVEVELERDLRLLRLAFDARLPCRARSTHPLVPPSEVSRTSAALPCPASPSTLASASRCGSAARSPLGEYSMTLDRLTKSSVPSGEAKRAVPAVGSTGFGPATQAPPTPPGWPPRKNAPARRPPRRRAAGPPPPTPTRPRAPRGPPPP